MINLLLIALLASMLDALIGGHKLLGRLPGPDRVFYLLHHFIGQRLNKAKRGSRVLILRGMLWFMMLALLAAYVGFWLDSAARTQETGFWFAVLTLALISGQKLTLARVHRLAREIADPKHSQDPSRFAAARWGTERLTLRFADGIVASYAVFLLGGFTLLLPYRALSMMMAEASPAGLKGPEGDFCYGPRLLYSLLAWVPVRLSVLLLNVASLFVPGAARANWGLLFARMPAGLGLETRLFPMTAAAHIVPARFPVGGEASYAKPHSDTRHIGPEGAPKDLTPSHLKRAILLSLIGHAIVFLIMTFSLGLIYLP